jgi:phage/plasmid-associated DNA primase
MNLLEAACKYAQQGWKVFPLKPKEKKPLIEQWQHQATDDIEQIIEWWTNSPKANIGVVTGIESGIWVLDIDVKKDAGGIQSMQELVKKHERLPITLVQHTPSGGYHYFFKCDDTEQRNTTASLPGVDTRANGGYVVVAPSYLSEFEESYKFVDVTIPPNKAPDWLYNYLEKQPLATKKPLSLVEGSRNDSLFRIASKYRDMGFDYQKTLALISVENQNCQPPLSTHELTTIVNSAMKYEPAHEISDDDFAANGKTPGSIVLSALYSNGNYIAVNQDLYKYTNGYYVKLDDGGELKAISKLLSKCITNTKSMRYDYEKASHCNDALAHVKNFFYVPVGLTNPVGINLKNGVLRPAYNGDKVDFELIEHSPDYYYLYQADFKFKPEADNAVFEEILSNMLDPEPARALLRNISAAFDMKTIRLKHTRALRALILNGQGSNGKDSLRTWCSLLFGKEAFSNVPLQVLKRADSNREFQINDLARAKINWASENAKVMIDSCQLVKQIITGDPIVIEKKHKEPFTFEPEIVMLFNSNDMPSFESLAEAIQTRYAIVPFPYVFKSNPNPALSYERLADPKLKHDPIFLKEHIMPSFLNALIREFKLLLKDGIDYKYQQSIMDDIREDNNHFFSFLQDMNYIECDPELGLTPSEIYDSYREWCINEKFIIVEGYGREQYNHPHEVYDKVLKNYRNIKSKLMKFYPRLREKRTNKFKRYGLMVFD